MFSTVALVGKYRAEAMADPLRDLVSFLEQRGHAVVCEQETAGRLRIDGVARHTLEEIGEMADVAIVVGGDGTMLGVARRLAPYGVPLIGVNQGRLGFMTDVPLDRACAVLSDMLDGRFEAEDRSLLDARLMRRDETVVQALALNDVVASRGAIGRMIELQVAVDGQFMYALRADGLIVATPTGSTAYALSAHGPILHPQLAGMVLVPVAPQALSNRPIVLPDGCTLEITVTDGAETSVHFDMQSLRALNDGDRIVVRRSPHGIRFLHPVGTNYFATLRRKLHWSANPTELAQLPSDAPPAV